MEYKFNNVLGYERDFLWWLDECLKEEVKDFILDAAWSCLMNYLDDAYENGKEYMAKAVRDIEDAGYRLKGYDNRTNIEYYLWDIIEDNIYWVTCKALRYRAEKEVEKLKCDGFDFVGDITEIVEQASEFYDNKGFKDLVDVVYTQIKKNSEEVA